MIIIHGSDQIKAKEKLFQQLQLSKTKGVEIERVEAANLSLTNLSQLLTPSSLFSKNRQVVIYNLLSLPQSNNKKKLVKLIKCFHQEQNILLFESKLIHPATIRSFNNSKIFQFKTNPLIFSLLESLTPQSSDRSLLIFSRLIQQGKEPMDKLFFLLVRHIHQLIQAKSPRTLKLPSWHINKLVNQSKLFTIGQLIKFQQRLYQIDKRRKTSQIKDLKSELYLCILKITAL